MLLPQGEQAAQQAGQHPGGRQQQSVLSARRKDDQRRKAHALHDHGVIQKDAVMVEESFRVPGDEFCSMTFHSASPFPVFFSLKYLPLFISSWRRTSVRSSQPEMLLTARMAKQTPVS